MANMTIELMTSLINDLNNISNRIIELDDDLSEDGKAINIELELIRNAKDKIIEAKRDLTEWMSKLCKIAIIQNIVLEKEKQ